jgi:hypothetical protein
LQLLRVRRRGPAGEQQDARRAGAADESSSSHVLAGASWVHRFETSRRESQARHRVEPRYRAVFSGAAVSYDD